MNGWQEDLLTTLEKPHTFDDILRVGERSIQALGFKNCTWITQLPVPLTRREVFAVANNDDEVARRVRSGWYNKAPVFRICAETSRPVMWTGRAEGRLFDMNPGMWEEHTFHWEGERDGPSRFTIASASTACLSLQAMVSWKNRILRFINASCSG